MEKLSVTEEQAEFIEALRKEISGSLVGPYGTVRTPDAVQFLIDQYEQNGVPPSEMDAETAVPRADEGGASDGVGDSTAPDSADAAAGATAEEPEEDDRSGDDGQTESEGKADDTDRLNQMMNLLDTHDDKWDEATSSDARYVVHMPDGTDEHVQTKDDVKALLFKNY